jgi:hypothetical protein
MYGQHHAALHTVCAVKLISLSAAVKMENGGADFLLSNTVNNLAIP